MSLLAMVSIKKSIGVSTHQLANCMLPWMYSSMNTRCTFLQHHLQVRRRKVLTCSSLAMKLKTQDTLQEPSVPFELEPTEPEPADDLQSSSHTIETQ